MAQSPVHGRPVPFKDFIGKLIGQPNLALALGAFLLGLLGNVLATVLGEWELWGISGNLLVLIVLGASVVALYIFYRLRRPVIEMRERQPTGKVGLILLLSTLNPRARGTPDEVRRRVQKVQEAAQRISSSGEAELNEDDFQAMLGTNLEPELQAMEFHYSQGTLRECWMIGTPDEIRADGSVVKGSAWLSIVLQRWFNRLHPGHDVRFSPGYKVKPRDYVELWNKVDTIFRRSPFRADATICDITGGLKLMSVGAALACLGDGRTMQYMATDRDWKGEPVAQGQMVPVLVDINPYLVWSEASQDEETTSGATAG